MRRVAELIYIVEEERAAFIEGAINPDEETKRILWLCGVRKQQYFALNDILFMTFEYDGKNFAADMNKMAVYLDSRNLLVKQRRKDVPVDQLKSTNWWAPVKRLASLLDSSPIVEDETDYNLYDMLDGSMSEHDGYGNISYDEDDWSEAFQF